MAARFICYVIWGEGLRLRGRHKAVTSLHITTLPNPRKGTNPRLATGHNGNSRAGVATAFYQLMQEGRL